MRSLIVGAGPAGIAAARALSEFNIEFDIVDVNMAVGGSWDLNCPGTPIYRSTRPITSTKMSGYVDIPMDDERYPSRSGLLRYLRLAACRIGLGNFTGGVRVQDIEWRPNRTWRVKFSTGEMSSYGAIIVATGYNRHPRFPSIPGTFSGWVSHSSQYRSSSDFVDRRVLIIGNGNSAFHISSELVAVADDVVVSMSRGPWFSPMYEQGFPTDYPQRLPCGHSDIPEGQIEQQHLAGLLLSYNQKLWNLGVPKPVGLPLETDVVVCDELGNTLSSGIRFVGSVDYTVDNTVWFSNGSRAQFDAIICATGYTGKIPLLDKFEPGLCSGAYLGLGNPDSSLFTVGNIDSDLGGFWVYELAARLIGRILMLDRLKRDEIVNFLPSLENLSGGCRFSPSPVRLPRVHGRTYLRAVKQAGQVMNIESRIHPAWEMVL